MINVKNVHFLVDMVIIPRLISHINADKLIWNYIAKVLNLNWLKLKFL